MTYKSDFHVSNLFVYRSNFNNEENSMICDVMAVNHELYRIILAGKGDGYAEVDSMSLRGYKIPKPMDSIHRQGLAVF